MEAWPKELGGGGVAPGGGGLHVPGGVNSEKIQRDLLPKHGCLAWE